MTNNTQNYHSYIVEHISNVNKVWLEFGKIIDELPLDESISIPNFRLISDNIREHDNSKLGSLEFYGYAQFFFPEPGVKKSKPGFEYAWNAHQKANKHHWEYWVMPGVGNKVLPMPIEYVIEMLCDWGAMSLKFKNIPSVWYAENTKCMLLHEQTTRLISRYMDKIDAAVVNIAAMQQSN